MARFLFNFVLFWWIRKLIEAIDEYDGDDPLSPWIEWVHSSFLIGLMKYCNFLCRFHKVASASSESWSNLYAVDVPICKLELLSWFLWKVYKMGTGGFSTRRRMLGTVSDIWAMCSQVLALGTLQGWSSLSQSLVGICNVLSLFSPLIPSRLFFIWSVLIVFVIYVGGALRWCRSDLQVFGGQWHWKDTCCLLHSLCFAHGV